MTTKPTLILVCLLAPLVSGAAPLDGYGRLMGKTVLMSATVPDVALSDSPADATNAIARIESVLAGKGMEVVQDGPEFVRVFPKAARGSLTNAPLRGAELAPPTRADTKGSGLIDFVNADLNQVLAIYAVLSRRTVLRPGMLPAAMITLHSQCALTSEEVVYAIATVLALNGIAMVDDGPKFVQAVPVWQRAATGAPKAEPGATLLPAGSINFSRADLSQVLACYAAMRQRTMLRPANLPLPSVDLKYETALTREEALYAMTKVFELNGIGVVDDGATFIQAVPMALRGQVTPRAPAPEPGAKLFNPREVPALGASHPPGPRTEVEHLERDLEHMRQAFYEFMRLPDPAKRSARRLLTLYAVLAGKTAVQSRDFDGAAIWFHVETPLTKRELLYAIETTLALDSLMIVPVDDQHIRLGWMRAEPKRVGSPQPKK